MRWLALAALALPSLASGQDFWHRGFLEYRGFGFPQEATNDRAHFIGEALFRYELERSLFGGLRLAGATETRIDTHHQVERRFYVNFSDRARQRPAFSI